MSDINGSADNAPATGKQEAVVAIYASSDTAQDAVARLKASGFPASDISIVGAAEKIEPAEESHPSTTRGVLIGAALGVLLSVEAVFLGQGSPGLEIGSVEEATQYGVSQSAPDPDAPESLYRDELQRGRVLVIAHAADPTVAESAQTVLSETDTLDLRALPFDFEPTA